MLILILAFETDDHCIDLINKLKLKCDYKILLVNDGTGKIHFFKTV